MPSVMGVLFAIAISMLMIPAWITLTNNSTSSVTDTAMAKQMQQITTATANYISNSTNAQSLITATNGGSSTTIALLDLQTGGYLPSSFNTGLTNAYGQVYNIVVTQPTAGSLQGIVFTSGGKAITDNKELIKTAHLLGAEGGFIPNPSTIYNGHSISTANIQGAYGTWNTAAPAGAISGHLATLVSYNSTLNQGGNWLSRVAVSGQPQLNQMQTDIDANGNSINHAKSFSLAATISGGIASFDGLIGMVSDAFGGSIMGGSSATTGSPEVTISGPLSTAANSNTTGAGSVALGNYNANAAGQPTGDITGNPASKYIFESGSIGPDGNTITNGNACNGNHNTALMTTYAGGSVFIGTDTVSGALDICGYSTGGHWAPMAPASSKNIWQGSGSYSTTWTVPTGVSTIYISGCAQGGGAGGGYQISDSSGANTVSALFGGEGGDAGECVLNYPVAVTQGHTLNVSLGNGSPASNGFDTPGTSGTQYPTSGDAGQPITISDGAGMIFCLAGGAGGAAYSGPNNGASLPANEYALRMMYNVYMTKNIDTTCQNAGANPGWTYQQLLQRYRPFSLPYPSSITYTKEPKARVVPASTNWGSNPPSLSGNTWNVVVDPIPGEKSMFSGSSVIKQFSSWATSPSCGQGGDPSSIMLSTGLYGGSLDGTGGVSPHTGCLIIQW